MAQAAAANPFDQFDAAASTPPAAVQAQGYTQDQSQPVLAQAAPIQAAPAPSGGNPFDAFDAQQPATGRDALGGYLLPAAAPDAPAQPDGILDRADNVVRRVANAATLGGMKYVNAAETAVEQPLFHAGSDAPTFGQRYQDNLASERARMASMPAAVAIPLDLVGTGATIASGAPAAIGRGVLAGARLIPGANALLDAASTAVQPVTNLLSGLPGAAAIAPVAKVAAEGAGYGGVQGFNDGEGDLSSHLESAAIGAGTGAVLAPVVAGTARLVGKGITAAGRALSESGFGAKAPVLDAAGNSDRRQRQSACCRNARRGSRRRSADCGYHDGPASGTGGSCGATSSGAARRQADHLPSHAGLRPGPKRTGAAQHARRQRSVYPACCRPERHPRGRHCRKRPGRCIQRRLAECAHPAAGGASSTARRCGGEGRPRYAAERGRHGGQHTDASRCRSTRRNRPDPRDSPPGGGFRRAAGPVAGCGRPGRAGRGSCR